MVLILLIYIKQKSSLFVLIKQESKIMDNKREANTSYSQLNF